MEPLDSILPGKKIIRAHQSNGHGDVLILDFDDGMELVVWSFDRPDNQQIVLWNRNENKMILDLRSKNCKQYTEEELKWRDENQPNYYGNNPPLFKVHHDRFMGNFGSNSTS